MILSVSPANSSWLSRICRNFPSDTRRFRYDYFFFCRCQVTTRTQRAGASSTTSVPRPDQRTGISSPKKWHCCRRVQCKLDVNLKETSAPVGAWEVKLEILTDKRTDQPTHDAGHTRSKGNYTSKVKHGCITSRPFKEFLTDRSYTSNSAHFWIQDLKWLRDDESHLTRTGDRATNTLQ